jgi:hypothetical protein
VDLNIIYQSRLYLDKNLQKILKENVDKHIQQSPNDKESWLYIYKTIIKENISKHDGEIWKETEAKILEEIKNESETEYNKYNHDNNQITENEGNIIHQPLNPTPFPGEIRACVTLGQDTSSDDQ